MVKISLIIPIYNEEKYLEECLDSVLNQTFTDFEIICINDGSTDSSLKILEKYKSISDKLKVITQENRGLGHARNRGLEIAKGEYICFLDGDDWLAKEAFEKLY